VRGCNCQAVMSSADDNRSGRRTTWTLGAIKQRNLALDGYCVTTGCGRIYVFDVDELIASAGAEYLVPEIIPGMTCTACGGAGIQAGHDARPRMRPRQRGQTHADPALRGGISPGGRTIYIRLREWQSRGS
jgi:hypothetical protein